jgi:citronellol/citronellal dehydrogenase
VVNNNLTGGFLMAREVFNQSMRKTGGAIVNMLADMWGGMPGMGHSGAARAGMLNFTETAAVEWGHAGVRVNAVAPGWVASSGLDNYDESFQKEFIPKTRGAVPLQRLFLLTPAAAFVTGAWIAIDGGASRNTRLFPLTGGKNSIPYDGFHRAVRPKVLSKF